MFLLRLLKQGVDRLRPTTDERPVQDDVEQTEIREQTNNAYYNSFSLNEEVENQVETHGWFEPNLDETVETDIVPFAPVTLMDYTSANEILNLDDNEDLAVGRKQSGTLEETLERPSTFDIHTEKLSLTPAYPVETDRVSVHTNCLEEDNREPVKPHEVFPSVCSSASNEEREAKKRQMDCWVSFLKHCPLFYVPNLLMSHLDDEAGAYVEQLLLFTTHSRQIIDYVIDLKSFNEFLVSNLILPEVISKIPTSNPNFDGRPRTDTVLSVVVMNLLLLDFSYQQIFTLFKNYHLRQIFGRRGSFVQDIKKLLENAPENTSSIRAASDRLTIYAKLSEELDQIDAAVYRSIEMTTTTCFLFSRVIKYLRSLKGVVGEPVRLWPITDEKMSTVCRQKVSQQFEDRLQVIRARCHRDMAADEMFWGIVKLNFYERSVDQYVSPAQMKRGDANESCLNEEIKKEAEHYGVPAPIWDLATKAMPLCGETVFHFTFKFCASRKEVLLLKPSRRIIILDGPGEDQDTGKRKPSKTEKPLKLSKKDNTKSRETGVKKLESSLSATNRTDLGKVDICGMAREGWVQVNKGSFANAALVYEELLAQLGEQANNTNVRTLNPDHVMFARIFCLHRSSQDIKLIMKLIDAKCATGSCAVLWLYCRAFFLAEKFEFEEAKKAALLVDEEKLLHEQLPEWPQQQTLIDVISFSKPNCNYSRPELQKLIEDRLHKLLNPPTPLAVCVAKNCRYPRAEIYKGDPFESDCVYCLECTQHCKLHYHSACWKKFGKKYNLIIGNECFAPDCVGNVKSIVLLEVTTGKERRSIQQKMRSANEEAKGIRKNRKSKQNKKPSEPDLGGTAHMTPLELKGQSCIGQRWQLSDTDEEEDEVAEHVPLLTSNHFAPLGKDYVACSNSEDIRRKQTPRPKVERSEEDSGVSVEVTDATPVVQRESTMPLRMKQKKTHKRYNNMNNSQPHDTSITVKPSNFRSDLPSPLGPTVTSEDEGYAFETEPQREIPRNRSVQEVLRWRRAKVSLQSELGMQK